jgi:hypothetical protein
MEKGAFQPTLTTWLAQHGLLAECDAEQYSTDVELDCPDE